MSPRSASTDLQAPEFRPVSETPDIAHTALFVIWPKGRHAEARILSDLADRFELLDVYEVEWSAGRIMENYRRFYSDLPVRGVYHSHAKGRGPFVAAVVEDPDPEPARRMTSRGWRRLNGRLLDAKLEYREWAGELTIHSTETPFETERDLTMLFGVDPERIARLRSAGPGAGSERIQRDLTGAAGWASEAELFDVLNRSVRYVVTGAPGLSEGEAVLHRPGVNLVTDDYLTLHAVLNARPGVPWPHGGRFRVRIAGRWVDVGVRYVGDGFFPTDWSRRLLEAADPPPEGRAHPPVRDDILGMAYHGLFHGGGEGRDRLGPLTELADRMNVHDWPGRSSEDARTYVPAVARWLDDNGLTAVKPRDPLVDFDPGAQAPATDRVSGKRRSRWAYRLRHGLHRGYIAARDQLLYRLPVIRRLRTPALRRLVPASDGDGRAFALKRLVLLVRGLLFLGRRYRCPCCGWSFRGFTGQWAILKTTTDGYCPRCNAKARHRRLLWYLREHTDLLDTPGRILEIAPWWAVSRRLQRASNLSFVGLDLERRGPHVTVVGDATVVPLASGCIDSALCIHTLEHIEDDRRAMEELHRVLKPGGCAVVSVPLHLDRPTYEDASITDPAERARAFGERSHVRAYGLDLRDRLQDAGFRVDIDWAREIPDAVRKRYGLRGDENLFICRKAESPV